MKKPTSNPKINKSTKYYLICGGIAIAVILSLLLLYALLTGMDLIAWFGTKYAFLTYGAIMIYATIGIILFVKDKIRRM